MQSEVKISLAELFPPSVQLFKTNRTLEHILLQSMAQLNLKPVDAFSTVTLNTCVYPVTTFSGT